jgi:hypothetical protein
MADDGRLTFFGTHRFARTFFGKGDLMRNLVAPMRSRLDGLIKRHVKNAIAEGDRVVVEAEGEARTKGGRRYNNRCCILLERAMERSRQCASPWIPSSQKKFSAERAMRRDRRYPFARAHPRCA